MSALVGLCRSARGAARVGGVLALALTGACQSRPAPQLSVERDTMTLYGTDFESPPVRGMVKSGELTLTRRNVLTFSSDTAVENRYGNFRCRKSGTAEATVRVGSESVRFTVVCRLPERVASRRWVSLRLGVDSADFSVDATFEGGATKRLYPETVSFEPEGVAVYAHGAIVPVGVGSTRAVGHVGGLSFVNVVVVRRVLARDTLALRPGEFRSWQLERGRYTLTVRPAAAGDPMQWLDVAAEGTKCSRLERTPDTVYCVVYNRADLGVRNVIADARVSPRRAFVELTQTQ